MKVREYHLVKTTEQWNSVLPTHESYPQIAQEIGGIILEVSHVPKSVEVIAVKATEKKVIEYCKKYDMVIK